MKSTTNTKKATPTPRRAKRTDRGVPFEEMRRLMHVYGSVKCLRKRQSKTTPDGTEENTKVDSVKRKFYRWFPDLDERFTKDEEGLYRPRMGHEFELLYREQMRTKDGEILAEKRARCRKDKRQGGAAENGGKKRRVAYMTPKATSSSWSRMVSTGAAEEQVTPFSSMSNDYFPRVSPNTVTPASSFSDREVLFGGAETGGITLECSFDYDSPMASANITADTEPLDRSFTAEKNIFDDVEKSFYGPAVVQDCPKSEQLLPSCVSSSSSSSSSSSEKQDSSRSRLCGSPSLEDMLGQSIEECCDEILGSNDNDLFDMVSS